MNHRFSFLFVFLIIISVGFQSIPNSFAETDIPEWVKGIANFWIEGKISDSEFADAITFLIDNGILKVELTDSLEKEIRELKKEIADLRALLGKLPAPKPPPPDVDFTLNLSENTYEEGDTIVISGTVDEIIEDAPMTIRIFFQSSIIDIAQIVIAQDGSFSHTIKAEGASWSNDGIYVVRADYGAGTTETQFAFITNKGGTETTNIFEVDAGNAGTFDVDYTIFSGTVKNMLTDPDEYKLVVIIETEADGFISIELPRNAIDAKKSDGTDDTDDIFLVDIDGREVRPEETSTTQTSRILKIEFEEGDSDIEIIGTFIIS